MTRFNPATITNRLLAGLTFAGAALIGVSLHGCDPARAQGFCFDTKTAKRIMQKQHQVPTSSGQADATRSIVMSADAQGNRTVWTFFTNGMACPTASGTGWEPGKLPEAEGRGT